jgi:hypothetical protein
MKKTGTGEEFLAISGGGSLLHMVPERVVQKSSIGVCLASKKDNLL